MNQPTEIEKLEKERAYACKSVITAADREAEVKQTLATVVAGKHEALAFYFKVSEDLRRERAKPI